MKTNLKKISQLYTNMTLPVKASMWYLACSVLQKAIGFLTTPIFTRVMGTSDFGIVSMYNSWEAILTVLCTLYLYNGVYNNAMIEYKSDKDGFTSSMQTLTTILSLIVFSVLFVFYRQLADVIGLSKPIMLLMMIDIVFSAGMSFWSIRNRYEYKYKSVAVFTILSSLLMPALSVILVLNSAEHKAEARILGTVVTHVIVYGIVYFLNLTRGKKAVDLKYWKYGIKFNLPLIPHYLSSTIMTQSDRVLINTLCGSSAAGIYSISTNVTSIMNIVTVSINQAVTPWIYEMLEAKKMKEIGKNVYKIVSLVGVGFVLTSFIVPEVIGVLAPSEYKSAIWATPPLLIGMFMYFIYCNFGNVEIYFHKQNAMLFSSVTVAVINIILNYILIQKYGYIAASYTTMVSYYIYAGLHYMFMSRVCKEKKVENPFNASVIIVMTIVFSVLIMCPVLLYRVVLLRYSILAVICIICLLWAIKNRDFILQLISKKGV